MTNSNQGKPPADSREPQPHKTPFWVKGFLVAAALLIVTFAVLHLSGGTVMNHTP